MSLYFVVILVPVLFGMMGFAIDLGRLYLVRGELSQAANALALTAASQLLGTAAAADNMLKVLPPNGPTYKYNFGGTPVGVGTGNLTSNVLPPNCFDTVANATSGTGAAGDCGTAQAVQIIVTADAPLLFWSLLPGGSLRKTGVGVQAVAGISAPLCTACNIVPMAVPPIEPSDTTDFGYVHDLLYTLSYSCAGTPAPINYPFTSSSGPALAATVPYVFLNRYDTNNSTLDEFDQLYVSGAQGVLASTNPTVNALTSNATTPLACFNLGDTEQLWASGVPPLCATGTNPYIQAFNCGLYSRLDNGSTPSLCSTAVTDFGAFSYLPDPDGAATETPPYSAYTGNGRRILTVAIVDALPANTASPMTVLAFRQFLVVPNPDGTFFDPGDGNGRIPVLYIGNPAPVPQGWFDTRYAGGSCRVGSFSGPGKVVLHQ